MNNVVDIEKALTDLPDKVADALVQWKMATLDKEKCEALLYLRFKGEDIKRTSDELKSLVRIDGERYSKVVTEIQAEGEYNRLYEKLMGAKKAASLRVAF